MMIGPLEALQLVNLVLHVRHCPHGAKGVVGDGSPSAFQPEGTQRWCAACGSVFVEGVWTTPAWFVTLDGLLKRWEASAVEECHAHGGNDGQRH
jgi:hypothetical protein